MSELISHLFDDRSQANSAVVALERAGFKRDDISVLARGEDGEPTTDDMSDSSATGNGATMGMVAGAGVGILASIGAIAIPGIGPLVAAGILATTVAAAGAGAVTGGIVGALIEYGFSEDDANVYSEAVRRGSVLVSVTTTPARASEAMAIMRDHGAVDADSRRKQFEATGWKGYDPKAPPFSSEEAERERRRRSA